jgi:RND family efflux transporter MFP subunit
VPSLTLPRLVWTLAALAAVASGALFFWSPAAVARRERTAAREAATPDAAPDVAAAPQPRPAVSVQALRVDRGATHAVGRVSGLLAPARRVTLSAEEAGAIDEVLAEEHTRVEADQVLVRLDATAHRAAVARAESALIRARAALELARSDLERQQNLQRRDFTSAAELDRARNQERAAFAALGEARASLTEARDRLRKTEIRAPFAGVVNWLDLEPGTFLQRGDRVAELLDLAAIEIEVGVSDRQVVALGVGEPVQVRVDVFPGESFAGEIARVGRSADTTRQSYPVEVRVPNPEERLLPGMVADVLFTIGGAAPAILIPRRSTRREYEIDYVYVLDEGSGGVRVRQRRVSLRPLPFRPEWVEVLGGLEPGERIAVSGVESLRDGLEVRLEAS